MATAAGNLSVPTPADDTMEMSSPARQALEDDIDFDDWLPDDNDAQVNDDRMMDDGDQTRPGTATDDVMEDDMHQSEQTLVQEEVMQDSPSQVQAEEDEELIDYSDDEPSDEVVEDAGASEGLEQPTDTAPIVALLEEDVDEEVDRSADVHEPSAQDATEGSAVAETMPAPVNADADASIREEHGDYVTTEAAGATEEASGEAAGGNADEQAEAELEEEATGDADANAPPISLDTSVQPSGDGPTTPTDTGLHAMIVRFNDNHLPLFKSRNQPDGLLKNDNLASLSLGELMQNCRQRLAMKTGEELPEEQDLVLVFDQLGLMLVEDSSAAFEASLNEVLDVYLQLHKNDGTEEIPPFSLTLSLQLKFISSISVLKQAATGGQGLSHFGLSHFGEEGQVREYHDEYVEEEYEEQDDQEYGEDDYVHVDNEEETEHGDAAQVGDPFPEQQEAHTNDHNEYHNEQQNTNQSQDGYYQEDQEQYQEHFGDDHYYEEQPGEATQLLDEHALAGDGSLEESAGDVGQAPDEAHPATEEAAHPTEETPAGEEKDHSSATSTTLQEDDGHEATEQTFRSDEEYTAYLEENGDGPYDTSAAADQPSTAPESTAETVAPHTAAVNDAASGQAEPETQDLDTEDYIGDFEEQDHNDHEIAQSEAFKGMAAADNLEDDGQDYNQADEYHEQQDPNHPEYQPGEDNQDFRAAYELFDGEDVPGVQDSSNKAGASLAASSANGAKTTVADEDFIDFDLDEPPVSNDKPAGSRTPTVKRSYDDLADDEIDFDSPEPKKQKAS